MREGTRCELHFLNAFKYPGQKPYWLLSVKFASARLDVLGVDAIARVRYPGGDTVDVPIQIKSRRTDVSNYYVVHPEAKKARVVVLVLSTSSSFDLIRAQLYERIEALRSANVRFEEYFRTLEPQRLSGIMRARINTIASERVGIEAAFA